MNNCLVCGNPKTVKSHLMPRSLMLDMKGDDTKIYEGERNAVGVKYRQNGYWDNSILCAEHEQESGWGDDYSVNFIRNFFSKASLSATGNSWEVQNPDPEKLVHFAYSVIWKHAVSKHGKKFNMTLGKYQEILKKSIFNRHNFDQQLLIGDPNLTADELTIRNIALAPYRQRLGGLNTWHFMLGGLEFFLNLDQRRFPKIWEPYLANANTNLIVSKSDAKNIGEVRLFDNILTNMFGR